MHKGRLEAFSDGVLAIIITIMVLELKVPHEADLHALKPMIGVFLRYAVSFAFVGIYWNNHHHLFQAVHKISGGVLWANLHLLFWLSLIPFATNWMGENGMQHWPVAFYGIVLFFSGAAYFILTKILLSHQRENSDLVKALSNVVKEKISVVVYLCAIPLAFVEPIIAYALYVLVAIMWLVPDRRIEKTLAK